MLPVQSQLAISLQAGLTCLSSTQCLENPQIGSKCPVCRSEVRASPRASLPASPRPACWSTPYSRAQILGHSVGGGAPAFALSLSLCPFLYLALVPLSALPPPPPGASLSLSLPPSTHTRLARSLYMAADWIVAPPAFPDSSAAAYGQPTQLDPGLHQQRRHSQRR